MRITVTPGRTARLSIVPAAVVLAAAAMLLGGCEVTETSQTYSSGPVCPANYNPVCAERRGQERTFPNACEADAANWRIVAYGQCRADNYYGDYRRDRDPRRRDYRDYSRDRDYRRYSDRNRTVTQPTRVPPAPPVQSPPPVRQVTPVPPVAPAGACPQIVEEVCGQLGNQTQKFMNRCELKRAGAIEVAAGLCGGGNN